MRILVTGGCGFIGGEVVRQLIEGGHTVRVVDDLSKGDAKALKGAEFIQCDLRHREVTKEVFAGYDVCINLAAKIGGIGYFHKYPATILADNDRIYGATFEAAADHGYQRMVYVSSSMVYESTSRFPSSEEDLASIPVPVTAYGFSKLSGEWYCRAFREERGLCFSIVRPFNAYGVNEWPTEEVGYAHVIPDLVKKILAGQDPLEILGDGEQTRSFTHVRDVAAGIVLAATHPAAENEDFNLGSEEEVRILDLARRIHEVCRPGREFQSTFVPGYEHDIKRRIPDSSKARRLLGWKTTIPLETGLAEVVKWLTSELSQGGETQ